MIAADGHLVESPSERYVLFILFDADPSAPEAVLAFCDRKTREIREQQVPLREGWQRRAERRLARLEASGDLPSATPRSLTR